MGIVGSQIKTKRIFSMVRVITSLKCCWHGIVNLDKLILIMKNWPNDLKFGCTNGSKSFEEFFNFEDDVVFENENFDC
jgi:hypothetical protein